VKFVPVCDAVVSPVSVMVTFAVAVVVDPPGAYCSMIVQLLPGEPTPPTVRTAIRPRTAGDGEGSSGGTHLALFLTVIVPE